MWEKEKEKETEMEREVRAKEQNIVLNESRNLIISHNIFILALLLLLFHINIYRYIWIFYFFLIIFSLFAVFRCCWCCCCCCCYMMIIHVSLIKNDKLVLFSVWLKMLLELTIATAIDRTKLIPLSLHTYTIQNNKI